MTINDKAALTKEIYEAVNNTKIVDVHTHLYETCFDELLLWGIDELLTYHYLVAEVMRQSEITYEQFWELSKKEQADLIWKKLFIENSPVSEACRGVLTVLRKLGLDVSERNLDSYRAYFNSMSVDQYMDKVFEISNVESIVMTNDPFDDCERPMWQQGIKNDNRCLGVLRIDALLNNWESSYKLLLSEGYDVDVKFSSGKTLSEVRRFLEDWIEKMDAKYMAASLPPTFSFPENSSRGLLIEKCILPVSREKNVPFAMMIGVKKLVNPHLQLAGDAVGKSIIETVEYLCANYQDNKFLVTMLARENQHELCIAARKFRNLMIFGCWWFLNNPSLIEEITRMRMELLGTSFIPQHSDARVLDQLIYKWDHSRKIIAKVLIDKYSDLMDTGWVIESSEIKHDVENLFKNNFNRFLES